MKSTNFGLLKFSLGGVSLCLMFSVLSQYLSRFMAVSTPNGIDMVVAVKMALVIFTLSVVSALVVAIPSFWLIRKDEIIKFSFWSAIIGFFIHTFIKYGGIVNLLLMVLGNPFYLLFASITLLVAYAICFISMISMLNLLNRRFPRT